MKTRKFPHERILHNAEANIQEVKRKFYRERKQREVAISRQQEQKSMYLVMDPFPMWLNYFMYSKVKLEK